ncbi:MAG: hypothetical protein HYY31_02730 [Chloroflexi bacterium]|nr:hypothetical protein [Chloroflexota bacterium]
MATIEEIRQRIQAIRDDRKQGASALAREALLTLRLAATMKVPRRELLPYLQEVASALREARPAMASIKNASALFLDGLASVVEVQRGKGGEKTPADWCDELLRRFEEASRRAAEVAASLVAEGTTVITCSYSSAVVRALSHARGLGRRFWVVTVEEAFSVSDTQQVKESLAPWGIPVQVVSLPASGREATIDASVQGELVLVGADKLVPDGSLVNGAPTLLLAQKARGRLPFYAVCEGFKLDEDPTLEPGFELVPAALITGIATERGLLAPENVRTLFPRWQDSPRTLRREGQ